MNRQSENPLVADRIHKDLALAKKQRNRDFLLVFILLLCIGVPLILLMGVRPFVNEGVVALDLVAISALFACVLLIGAVVLFLGKGRKWSGLLAFLLLVIPAIALFSGKAETGTLAEGTLCAGVLVLMQLFAAGIALFLMIPHIPVTVLHRWTFYLAFGGVTALFGTLLVHLHCPANDMGHLGLHVGGAWLGAFVTGFLAMRFHRAWWKTEAKDPE